MRARAWLACLWLLAAATPTAAVETVMTVPVAIVDSQGRPVEGRIPVTVFKPPGEGPFPAVIVSHGRPGTPSQRAGMGRVRLSSVTTTLLGLRMVVIVPTRLGYGVSAADDPEFFGSCEQPQYRRAFEAGGEQVVAAVGLARSLPYVDPESLFLIGYSVGGGVTVNAAARKLPGVRAAVNFSGGHGGRETHPGEPCRSDLLQEAFAAFGRTQAPVPQLWVYVENDEFIAPERARQWFDAFVAAGGSGELRIVPKRRHGHDWFAVQPVEWRDLVMEFFASHGMKPPHLR